MIASPHQAAHVVMVAEGSPGRCFVIANLAAHLCGYTTYKINPSPVSSPEEYTMKSFKSDLVTAYTRAGVKVFKTKENVHYDTVNLLPIVIS